ncbi:MAG: hypothetical protein ACJ764_10260 [Solirubrobacteraceae bacterium]
MTERRGRRTVRWARFAAVAAVAACVVPGTASALASFTWSGQARNNPFWSAPANWSGHTVPGGSVGTLVFPKLGGGCSPSSSSTKSCYLAGNDVSGLSAEAISIDDAEGYSLSGDPITLGAGGITAAPQIARCPCGPTTLAFPINLSARQTWSLSAGAPGSAFVSFGNVKGPSHALHIVIKKGVELNLQDMQVGALSITSPPVARGFVFDNGVLLGQPGHAGSLNGADAKPVSLSNVALASSDSVVGPLTASHNAVLWDAGFQPAGSLTVHGKVSLGSTSEVLVYVSHAGSTAGKDYWQLRSSGNVALGGSHLVLSVSNSRGFGPEQPCPRLHAGDVETLVSTTGFIRGKFEGVSRQGTSTGTITNGAKVPITCRGKTQLKVRIHYHAHSVTATVQ